MKNLLLVILVGVAAAVGPDCFSSPCPNHLYTHYYAKNCVPEGKDPCCPTNFNCPPFVADAEHCIYLGKNYSLGEMVPVGDPCSVSCMCSEPFFSGGETAEITCADVECPSLFRPSDPNCRDIYEFGECCEVDQVCGIAKQRGSKCTHKSRSYHVGDNMYFDEHPCRKCICGPNYSGPFGPGCETFSCGMEFRYISEFSRGCTPIRFEEGCCPIDWLCPGDSRLPQSKNSTDGADCILGNFGVRRNEVIDLGDCHLVCGCLTPPELTCNKYRDCERARNSGLFPSS